MGEDANGSIYLLKAGILVFLSYGVLQFRKVQTEFIFHIRKLILNGNL